jgi:hypothetical protein
MSRFRISRRQLLGAAATTAVAGLVLARETNLLGNARDPTDASDPTGAADASDTPGANDRTAPTAAWLDGMLSGDDLAQARATLAGVQAAGLASVQAAADATAPPSQPRMLEHDLLWQWRRDLAQELRQGVRAVAITRWDKAILLNGLAREAALPVRQSRIGRSLFQTEIG